jgi:tetratricopeptide (TPR) repeat protein
MGRFAEAAAEIGISVELDPLAANASSLYGFALFLAGQTDRALERIGQAIELDSASWIAYAQLGQIREAMSQLDAAIPAYEKAVAHSGSSAKQRAALARALALSGREDDGRRMLQVLRVVATVFLALGDVEGAISWLESAYLERHPDLLRLPADPRFAALKGDPRFMDLLDRIGLPPWRPAGGS